MALVPFGKRYAPLERFGLVLQQHQRQSFIRPVLTSVRGHLRQQPGRAPLSPLHNTPLEEAAYIPVAVVRIRPALAHTDGGIDRPTRVHPVWSTQPGLPKSGLPVCSISSPVGDELHPLHLRVKPLDEHHRPRRDALLVPDRADVLPGQQQQRKRTRDREAGTGGGRYSLIKYSTCVHRQRGETERTT